MKNFYSFALMALTMGFVFVSCDKDNNDSEDANAVKSYTLSISLDKADSLYLATNTDNVYGYGYNRSDITIGQFVLTHSHADWGYGDGNTFGEGFTFTNSANDSICYYLNNAAITANGVRTNAYFTANAGGGNYEGGMAAEISFKDSVAYNAKECYITNSTYAYLHIKNNEKANHEAWGANDWFKLTITGYNKGVKTDKVELMLADGTSLISNWQQVDLTKLGKVTSIKFTVSSTDNNEQGMVTPAYFCLDQLTVTE